MQNYIKKHYASLQKSCRPFSILKRCVVPASLSQVNVFPGVKVWVEDVSFMRLDWYSRTAPHMHTSPDIFYVNQGKMALRVYGRLVGVEAGNMILIPSGVFHSVECRHPAEYYCVNYIARIDKTRNKSKPEHFARWMLSPLVMIGENHEKLRPAFEAILEKKEEVQGKKAVLKTRLSGLIRLIARGFKDSVEISRGKKDGKAGVTNYDRRIAESIRYIRRQDLGHAGLVELCRNRIGMSPRNFSRIFKGAVGCSPREYILRLRMEKARAMIGKEIPTNIVAEELGYEDIHSFYRAFHKATGHGVRITKKRGER